MDGIRAFGRRYMAIQRLRKGIWVVSEPVARLVTVPIK